MPSRLVITPWDGKNESFLDRCKESVAESGIEHRIVKCGSEWSRTMFTMRNDADAIAWVDADDIVYPGALIKSFETLEQNDVGLVHTDECRIDINDKQINISTSGPKTLWDLASHPGCIHHLVVTKKNSITDRALEIFNEIGVPLDWIMKVDAGANHGIKHVPILGYGWRIHSTQITSTTERHLLVKDNLQIARNYFREWVTGIKQI